MDERIEVLEPGERIEVHEEGHRLDVWNEVPLVPQLNGMSCWAAAAAMVIGWRDRVAVDGPEVARGAGRWREFSDGLHPRDVADVVHHWRLVPVRETALTVARLAELLTAHGPLWLGEAVPGLHVVVVTGLEGDGTEQGTWVRINDPWPVGQGERYRLTFAELVRNLNLASRLAGPHAQILHSGGRGSQHASQQSWTHSVRIETLEPAPAPWARLQGDDDDWEVDDVAWVDDDARSIDYRHLGVAFSDAPFALSHAVLLALCEDNLFVHEHVTDADVEEELVVFGLRGCEIVDGADGAWADTVTLREAVPDHVARRCVIGVWNWRTEKVCVFEGSTVPTASQVIDQLASPDSWKVANLLPTGRYTYTEGRHGKGDLKIPGALRQDGFVVVLRTFDDPVYDVSDRFHLCTPHDNIHADRSVGPDDPTFSSAGCQTVKGHYDGGAHQEAWADFRAAAGIEDEVQRTYVLLTGREARRVSAELAQDERAERVTLRFGSSGELVARLQARLVDEGFLEVGEADTVSLTDDRLKAAMHRDDLPDEDDRPRPDPLGVMAGHTTMAWVQFQQEALHGHLSEHPHGAADGIYAWQLELAAFRDAMRRVFHWPL